MTRIYLKDGLTNAENLRILRERLRQILPQIAGVKIEVNEARKSWHRDRGGKRIALRIFGEDSLVLSELGEEARLRLEQRRSRRSGNRHVRRRSSSRDRVWIRPRCVGTQENSQVRQDGIALARVR